MKIRTKNMPYEQVLALPRPKHRAPIPPSLFFRTLIRTVAIPDLLRSRVSYTTERMEAAGDGPYLILMNHSCFLDLEIAYKIFFPKPFTVVCTTDGFVGKEWLMRAIGSIPTQKYVSDVTLLQDIHCSLKKKNTSVLMFPEACYSFDGRATALPRRLGRLLKRMDVPVVTVITSGAFTHNPLYNELQRRKVKVSAHVKCLFTREEIAALSETELERRLDEAFSFDNFAWQYENRVAVTEPFRADGLHRLLYQCPHCRTESRMVGRGITLRCEACGKEYTLTEYGRMEALDGETEFPHIPDWYAWERSEVRRQLLEDTYSLDVPVKIGMLVDYKALYMVGEGRLRHDRSGFTLDGCGGKLHYTQSPLSSYGLNADYFWYEIGDIIGIGGRDALYYCFPQEGDVAAKTRLAAEELYRLLRSGELKDTPTVTE